MSVVDGILSTGDLTCRGDGRRSKFFPGFEGKGCSVKDFEGPKVLKYGKSKGRWGQKYECLKNCSCNFSSQSVSVSQTLRVKG